MIKTCKVIWKNPAIALVDFDGIDVQVPAEWLKDDEVVLEKLGDSFYQYKEGNDEEIVFGNIDETAQSEEENA